MAMKNRQNNRQKVTGPAAEYYLHPRKGYKRKRPHERLRDSFAELRIKSLITKPADKGAA